MYAGVPAIIPVSVKDCWDFLQIDTWNDSMPKIDPLYEGATVHGSYTVHHNDEMHDQANRTSITLCRKRTKRIFTFGKRDLVFLSISESPRPDGRLPLL